MFSLKVLGDKLVIVLGEGDVGVAGRALVQGEFDIAWGGDGEGKVEILFRF